MPRQPRFWFPGAVLHVIQRGNNRGRIFVDDADRHAYIHMLQQAAQRYGVAIHAYVLMPNHVHLLVTPQQAVGLPRMMQTAGRRYVGHFNQAHHRTGTLWEGRYRATLVDADEYFLACMRYIELNPVRACLVSAPEGHGWSSYAANALGAADPLVTMHVLYASLGDTPGTRCATYRKIVSNDVPESEIRAIRDATQHEWALAGEAFRNVSELLTGRRAARLSRGRRPQA